MTLALALALIAALAAPAPTAPAPTAEAPAPAAAPAPALRDTWAIGFSLRPEFAPGGRGIGTHLALRYRLLDWLDLDLAGRGLLATAWDDTDDDELYVALVAGLAYAPLADVDRYAPRAALRFIHVHHATTQSWRDTPIANIAGDSDGGVRHRSGLEVALGLQGPRLFDLWDSAGRLDFELSGSMLPSSDFFRYTVALAIGLTLDGVLDTPR